MDNVESAVEAWDTHLRVFVAANGEAPTEEAKRMTLIQMLPMEISAFISICSRVFQTTRPSPL